jgi:nuclear receptor interaction protein
LLIFFIPEIAQARPTLHATLMQRMTDVLSRMLNDAATRAALSGGGEDSLEGDENQGTEAQIATPQSTESSPDTVPHQLVSAESASTSQPVSSSSVSVPQLSLLSIHSSIPEAVDSNNESVPSCNNMPAGSQSNNNSHKPEVTDTVAENNSVLDLSQVPQLDVCSAEQPISSGTLGTSERNETDNATVLPGQDCSDSPSATRASLLMPDSEIVHHNISNLQDQLSTMREGFIER